MTTYTEGWFIPSVFLNGKKQISKKMEGRISREGVENTD